MTRGRIICELLSGTAFLVGAAAVSLHWSELPEIIPVHFNYLGNPDGYGPKGVVLFMLGIFLFTNAMLSFGLNQPHKANVPWKITEENKSETMAMVRNLLLTMKVVVMSMLGYITWAMVQCGLGRMNGLGAWFLPVFLVSMFLPIIMFFVRGRKFNKDGTLASH